MYIPQTIVDTVIDALDREKARLILLNEESALAMARGAKTREAHASLSSVIREQMEATDAATEFVKKAMTENLR